MGQLHDIAADYFYDHFASVLEGDSRWDCALKETEYFSPDPQDMHHQNPKGEMDVGLIDFKSKEIYYLEIKTRYQDKKHGLDQLNRAKDFFEDLGYDFSGAVYIVDGNESWIDDYRNI